MIEEMLLILRKELLSVVIDVLTNDHLRDQPERKVIGFCWLAPMKAGGR